MKKHMVVSWSRADQEIPEFFGDYLRMSADNISKHTRECVQKAGNKEIMSGIIMIPDNGSSVLKAERLRSNEVDIEVFTSSTTFSKEDVVDFRFCSDPQVAAEIAAKAASAGATILVATDRGMKNLATGAIEESFPMTEADGTSESIHFVD